MKHWPELVLSCAGVCLLSTGVWSLVRYKTFQYNPEVFTDWMRLQQHESNDRTYARASGVLGQLEIPRLGMAVLVVEGDDEESLSLAAGHVRGTAAFGAKGNSVIAGHRDTAFRPLRKIMIGDRIRLRGDATYEYVVENIGIVEPEDVSVVEPGNEHALTLITCYPFSYLGDAPKRYIARAKELVSYRQK